MKVYFDKKVLIGFFLALGILAVLGVYSYRNSQESIATSQMVSYTNEALYHIERLHSVHLQIEVELMRYTIDVDTIFFSFYRDKLKDAQFHFQTLMKMINDRPAQRTRLDTIRVLGEKKVGLINHVIQARKHSIDSVRKIIPTVISKALLARINETLEAMQQDEMKILDQHIAARQAETAKFYSTFVILLLATASIMVVLFMTINATLRARTQAEQALQLATKEIQDLYHNAPCGYHSVNNEGVIVEMNSTWFDWIGYKREEVINKMSFSQLLTTTSKVLYEQNFQILKTQGSVNNLELEILRKNGTIMFIILNAAAIRDDYGRFLKSRSTAFDMTDRRVVEEKVIAANKELEAFTYSVSHDLRTPLRSIDGYSKILQEDYGATMDEEMNRLVRIIRNNSKRMGELIDDLLDFSRLGRKELEKSRINMSGLVSTIKQELIAQEKGRSIEFVVNPLEEANADNSMMRQVWINLISNALKYSKRQPITNIEIGCKREGNQVVYYIRDNGVGFDMKYADKLFGVFQRLHKVEEFEGTGVGLALVHRIISRHGGKIWADAQVNKGATFFFFIPTQT